MGWDPAKTITPEVAEECRELVYTAARKWDIAPVTITAHWRDPRSDEARKEVMRAMISKMGLRRWQVAQIFGRDLRRVRKSALGV